MAVATAAALLAILFDHHVPELGAAAAAAANERAVSDDATTDAGADGQHHGVASSLRRAVQPLGEHRGVAVVVYRDRHAEPLPHQSFKWHANQRQVRRGRDHPGLRVENPGNAEANPDHLTRRCLDRLIDHRSEPVEQLGRVGSARGVLNPVQHSERLVDNADEHLRAPDINANCAVSRHSRHHTGSVTRASKAERAA